MQEMWQLELVNCGLSHAFIGSAWFGCKYSAYTDVWLKAIN